jgi:hypothetical protein
MHNCGRMRPESQHWRGFPDVSHRQLISNHFFALLAGKPELARASEKSRGGRPNFSSTELSTGRRRRNKSLAAVLI